MFDILIDNFVDKWYNLFKKEINRMEVNNNWFIKKNRFYDIDIDHTSRTYSVVEDIEEHSETALTIFEKIEKVLNLNFRPLNKEDSYKILKLAEHACQSYRAKIPTILTFFYNGLEEQFNEIKLSLGEDLNLQDKACLDRDTTHVVLSLLSTEGLMAYSLVNKNAKTYADMIMLERAKKAGFEGLDANDAHVYLKELYLEIKNLCEEEIPDRNPERYGAVSTIKNSINSIYLNKRYNSEQSLEALQYLNAKDLVYIYRDERFVNWKQYTKIQKFIDTQEKRGFINGAKEQISEENMKFFQANIKSVYQNKGLILLDILQKKGVEINFHHYDRNGTFFHLAVGKEDYKFCQFLVKNKVDIDKTNTERDTPLHIAVSKNNINIIKLLVDNGAKINVGDNWENTPLHRALKFNIKDKDEEDEQYEIVKFLLDKGAEIDCTNFRGNTALHLVKSTKLAKLLLNYGANVNIVNGDGETAEAICCKVSLEEQL